MEKIQHSDSIQIKAIEHENIIAEDLEALKFAAAFIKPFSVQFWSLNSGINQEILTNLVHKYELPRTEDCKVIPIEIPNISLVEEHKKIAIRGLNLWKNRINRPRSKQRGISRYTATPIGIIGKII